MFIYSHFVCVLIFICSKHIKNQLEAQGTLTNDTLKSPLPPKIVLLILNLTYLKRKNQGGGEKYRGGDGSKVKYR